MRRSVHHQCLASSTETQPCQENHNVQLYRSQIPANPRDSAFQWCVNLCSEGDGCVMLPPALGQPKVDCSAACPAQVTRTELVSQENLICSHSAHVGSAGSLRMAHLELHLVKAAHSQ